MASGSNEMSSICCEIASCNNEIASCTSEIASISNEITSVTSEIASCNNEITSLSSEITTSSTEITSFNSQMTSFSYFENKYFPLFTVFASVSPGKYTSAVQFTGIFTCNLKLVPSRSHSTDTFP